MRAEESIEETQSLMFAKQKLKREPPIFGIHTSHLPFLGAGILTNGCNFDEL
jgi:hypothetical protein